MIDEEMIDALNKQLNAELSSGYLYLSMATYFESIDLPGFANWNKDHANEEFTHAMKFYDYLVSRGEQVILGEIEAPPTEWDGPVAVYENILKHEQLVTGLINELVDLAISKKDHATNNFLQWFISEQVEEEETANGILQKVKLAGDDSRALLFLDKDMGSATE